MDDALLMLAADEHLTDDVGWAQLVSRATGVSPERLLDALGDPQVAATLDPEAAALVFGRHCGHAPDGGVEFHATLVRCASVPVLAPPVTADRLYESVAELAVDAPAGATSAAMTPVRQRFAAASPTPRVAADATMRLIRDGELPLFDATRTGVSRRVNVDVVAHLLIAAGAPATRLVLTGLCADPDAVDVAALTVVAMNVAFAGGVGEVAAPAEVAFAAANLAGELSREFLADPEAAPPGGGEMVHPARLAVRCGVWAARRGVAVLGDQSTTTAICGQDPAKASQLLVRHAWGVARDVLGDGSPAAGEFIEWVTSSGARPVPLPDVDIAALMAHRDVVSLSAVFATIPSAFEGGAVVEGIASQRCAWSAAELIEALVADSDLHDRVCAAAVVAAGSGTPVPRWLVERSQRRVGLATWVQSVPEVRAELAGAASGIGASRWSVLTSLLGEFRGTPAELVDLTDVAAPAT